MSTIESVANFRYVFTLYLRSYRRFADQAGCRIARLLVALPRSGDLLLCAKHLFVAARTAWHGSALRSDSQSFESSGDARLLAAADPPLSGRNNCRLPVQQPVKFELVINLRTAKALSLEVRIRQSAPTEQGGRTVQFRFSPCAPRVRRMPFQKCCDTHAPMHVTGPSCKLSNVPSRHPMMVLSILVGTSGNVAPRTHIKSHEVRLFWSAFAAAV